MKLKFNTIMAIVWSIVAIISGFYSVINGGAVNGEELQDPSINYIVASFGVPGLISIIFAFCNSVEDVVKIKSSVKEITDSNH